MLDREGKAGLQWQSKGVLLLAVPWAAVNALLQARWWGVEAPVVLWTTLGVSGLFGLVVWRLRAGTAWAAATGGVLAASLMFSTARYPYELSWLHGALPPLLAVFLLTLAATKVGRQKKERLGTGEGRRGRNAAQVAANLGVAALAAFPFVAPPADYSLRSSFAVVASFAFLTALAEAAADTVSSEIGQVFGGRPRLIASLGLVEPGTDGGITLAGSLAGALAALVVVVVGFWGHYGRHQLLDYSHSMVVAWGGGVFGMLFDSFLGATAERRGWLNNDAVNFLSTAAAVGSTFAVAALLIALLGPH